MSRFGCEDVFVFIEVCFNLIDCKRKRRKIEDGYTIISNASTSDLMTK